MLKRLLAMVVTTGVGVGILISCGSSSTVAPAPGTGTLVTLIADLAPCDVLSAYVHIDGLTLTAVGGVAGPAIIPSGTAYKANLGMQRDVSTYLNTNTLTAGSYNQATMTIVQIQMGVYDPSLSPPIQTIYATLAPAKPTFAISPSLTITQGQVSMLQLDLNLWQLIGVDSSGQISSALTPVITGLGVTASTNPSIGFGKVYDLRGFVRSVTTTSTNAEFTGSFLLQLLSASAPGPSPTVYLTSSTELNGVASLAQLLTGSFVEVDGYIDQNANLVANTVEVEFPEDLAENETALIGTVTALTKDSGGNLSEFDLWVQEEEPDDEADIPLDSIVDVDVSPSTVYQYSSRPVNFASLPFAPTSVTLGQQVVAHGPYTKTAGQPTRVAADAVYLELQPVQGNSSSIVQIGSDNLTGAFWLAPCTTLFQSQPILVQTNNQTVFLNLSGLSGLTSQPSLLVQGLLFFQPQSGQINGIPVPPGTLVLLAKQVHQL